MTDITPSSANIQVMVPSQPLGLHLPNWKTRDESVNFTPQVYVLNYTFRSAQFELPTEAQFTTDQWTAQLIPLYASSWQISDRANKPDRPDCSRCKLLGKLLDGGVTRLLVCISMFTFAYDWKKKTLPGFTASANNKRKHRSHSCASGTASVIKRSQFQQSILFLSCRPCTAPSCGVAAQTPNPSPRPGSAVTTVLLVGQIDCSVLTADRWILYFTTALWNIISPPEVVAFRCMRIEANWLTESTLRSWLYWTCIEQMGI